MKAYESNLDVFESVFKRSIKHHFKFKEIKLETVLVLAADERIQSISSFVSEYCSNVIQVKYGDTFDWKNFKKQLIKESPGLVVVQRRLGVFNEGSNYSIGPILESITQETDLPVLVLPEKFDSLQLNTIAIGFDHQIDNSNLVNKSLLLDAHVKNVELIHVEESSIFDYYMEAISRIPSINTDSAKESIQDTILSLSADFFNEVSAKLNERGVKTQNHCLFGETVKSYKKIIEERKVDLLVFEANDDSKMAMHSLGHSLSIQFPHVATLLV